jgi:SAM-dependent methyltransferase
MTDAKHTHEKEALFHDAWAESTKLEKVEVDAAFESILAHENRFILKILGNLKGRTILDIGAGLGESSVYFAKHGAKVTATDISPGMMSLAEKLAHYHGVSISTAVGPAENLPLEEASFDVVYIANTIHHVTNKRALLENAKRYLKPGGIFISWDPVKYNPVINIYRRMAMGVRTEDETPLGCADVRLAKEYFPDARARHFWIAGLVIFLKYFFIDRVHPNADRYWKRIYRETGKSLWWWRPFGWLDLLLTRIPGIRWLTWNMVMWGHRPL